LIERAKHIAAISNPRCVEVQGSITKPPHFSHALLAVCILDTPEPGQPFPYKFLWYSLTQTHDRKCMHACACAYVVHTLILKDTVNYEKGILPRNCILNPNESDIQVDTSWPPCVRIFIVAARNSTS
jgi:hypothetical protein